MECVSIGGGAKSETWAQIKADITGKDIIILDTRGVSSMYANDGGVIIAV